MHNKLQSILDSLKNPTPEQEKANSVWVMKHMNTAGRMTQHLFDYIMTIVETSNSISGDLKSPLDQTAFREVYEYLNQVLINKVQVDFHFPTTEAAFSYKGQLFVWCLTLGQGSFSQIRLEDEDYISIHNIPITTITNVDTTLGYYINPDQVNDIGERI